MSSPAQPDPADDPRPASGAAADGTARDPRATPRPTRRRLLGAGAVLVAGAAGTVAGVARGTTRDASAVRLTTSGPPPAPPSLLTGALARETTLIVALDRAAAVPSLAARARLLRADHVAHATAIRSLLAGYAAPSPTGSAATPTTSTTPAPDLAALVAAETRAAAAAAQDSAAADGDAAALLASIAACEASHAGWLT